VPGRADDDGAVRRRLQKVAETRLDGLRVPLDFEDSDVLLRQKDARVVQAGRMQDAT
jgi:hypothetical protein